MSIASYRRNVQRRVTGPNKPTCFPAALEQISPFGLHPDRYGEYMEFNDWFCSFPIAERKGLKLEYADMLDDLVEDLGGLTCEDVIFKRANTAIGLKRIINKLLEDGCHIAVDINWHRGWDVSHSVGLIPVDDDHFLTVSNQVPPSVAGLVTLDDIAKRLAVTDDKPSRVYPFHDANITALPPAA